MVEKRVEEKVYPILPLFLVAAAFLVLLLTLRPYAQNNPKYIRIPVPDKPLPTPTNSNGNICGGAGGIDCPVGFYCDIDTSHPDSSGVCREEDLAIPLDPEYDCPASEWINCMPIIVEEKKKFCDPNYLHWVKDNCPNFKGVSY